MVESSVGNSGSAGWPVYPSPRAGSSAMSRRNCMPSKLYLADRLVGFGAGSGEGAVQGADRQHPAAVGDKLAILFGGAGVKDLDARQAAVHHPGR